MPHENRKRSELAPCTTVQTVPPLYHLHQCKKTVPRECEDAPTRKYRKVKWCKCADVCLLNWNVPTRFSPAVICVPVSTAVVYIAVLLLIFCTEVFAVDFLELTCSCWYSGTGLLLHSCWFSAALCVLYIFCCFVRAGDFLELSACCCISLVDHLLLHFCSWAPAADFL